MKPMTPMKPMSPMKPMKPMTSSETAWWPSDLGEPSTSGAQGKRRYAFFPAKRRLLIDENGAITSYDTADETITGVSQSDGGASGPKFSTRNGSIDLDRLVRVE